MFDVGGDQPDRILAAVDLARFRLLAECIDALVHIGHELVEMNAALAHDRRGLEEQIHQHGLAATDLAVDVEALDHIWFALTRSEQPAERARFTREPILGTTLLALPNLAAER